MINMHVIIDFLNLEGDTFYLGLQQLLQIENKDFAG